MHVLITNDDGIQAAGLAALEAAVDGVARVTVVAPDQEHSGAGHRVSTQHALRVCQMAPDRYRVDGTPADCARLGLTQIATSVDWVLSGINHGGNLGVDIFTSGTVAAAREAAWLGKPAIAVSLLHRPGRDHNWQQVARMAAAAIRSIWARPQAQGRYWNVNLPDIDGGDGLPPLVDCPVESQHLLVDYERDEVGRYRFRGAYHERPRSPGSDVDVCFSGRIAVSQLNGTP
jgi:5'-nucleotidase